jgi:transcriptional regulator with XRE-family HTH domain
MSRRVLHTGPSVKATGRPDVRHPELAGTDNADMATIGEKIRARRAELGLKASYVYKKAGLSKQAYSSLENGHQHSSTKLHLICKVLGLNPDWVEFGKGPRLVTDVTEFRTSPPSPDDLASAIKMVQTDQMSPLGGGEVATVLKEVVEVAFILLSYPEASRRATMDMIRANAPAARLRGQSEKDRENQHGDDHEGSRTERK